MKPPLSILIKLLLQLAKKLDLRVVAEGVEQQSQQTFLTKAGCEIMPGDQLTQWLSTVHSFTENAPHVLSS